MKNAIDCQGCERILFDSKKTSHKTPFGCIYENEKCTLRVSVPLSCPVTYVYAIIEREDGLSLTVPLEKGNVSEGYADYSCVFSLYSSGLYFYYFVFEKKDSSFRLLKQGDGDTNMEEGEKWQITCLPEKYRSPERFEGKVVYQIFPDRFNKSGECDLSDKLKPFTIHNDINEPPIKGADENGNWNCDFYGGNLRGIEEKLSYLSSLGVGVIYLNPIFMAYSNHRYDTADYMRIDPMLGNENDFISLCKSAKEQGISIILDGVFSHVGSNSKYFDSEGLFGGGAVSDPDSPYRDWFDFVSYPDEYDCWWDVPTLPCVKEMSDGFLDLIIRNEDSVVAHWLSLGASGFRLDVADELPDEFIALLRKRVKEINPDAIVVGEVWEDASNKISYEKRRKYFSGGELDGVMNYVFRDGIINLLCKRIDAEEFASTVRGVCENYPSFALNCSMTLLSSHDTTRIQTELGRVLSDTSKGIKAASVLQYFLPGMPTIYYGDEVGMKGGDDPYNRAFFREESESSELIAHYRRLGKLRKDNACLRFGKTDIYSKGNELTVIRELGEEKKTLVLDVDTLEYSIY